MHSLPSLPGANFRTLTLAALAALTVGGTALGLGSSADDPTTAPLPTTTIVPADRELVGLDDEAPTDDPIAATTTVVETDMVDTFDMVDTGDTPVRSVDLDPVVAIGQLRDAESDPDPSVAAPVDAETAPLCAAPVEALIEPAGGVTVTVTAPDDSPASPNEAPATTAPVGSAYFDDDFSAGAAAWSPLSGSWNANDGRYVQIDPTGYDFIAQLSAELPAQYAVSVDLVAVDGPLGGGVIVGQPVLGSRRGATLIDFTDGGSFIRWGVYDADSGQYRYVGGVATGSDFDAAAPHRLTVEIRSDRTMVIIDGRGVGEFAPIPPGRSGLSTSLSAVSFDNVEIVAL